MCLQRCSACYVDAAFAPCTPATCSTASLALLCSAATTTSDGTASADASADCDVDGSLDANRSSQITSVADTNTYSLTSLLALLFL